MHTHSSASPGDAATVRQLGRRRTGAASVATLLALGLLPVLPWASPAQAAVSIGSNISAFPDRDMVVAVGYEAGEQLLVEVLRNDVVIGTTQGPAVETPEGVGLEINHGVEGTPAPGDCWTGFTPNIVGGDVIRVTAVDRAGTPADTMTVEDVAFSGDPVLEADGTVSVSGTATPGLQFAVEFRRDKPDPRFRRDGMVPVFEGATNKWKATFRPTATTSAEGLTTEQQRSIALDEASWAAVADSITETTLAELGEPAGVAAGCNGSADPNTLVGGLEPINIASGDVTFSGTTRPAVAAVSVTVGALGALNAVVDTAADTWTLTVPKADLLTLPDGSVSVTPRFDTLAGAARTVLKDTVAPAAPSPSVAPGTYSTTQAVVLNKPAGESTSKVYWEIGNSAVPDPTVQSNLYTSQISVTSTQTLKGRLIDAAGNPGVVGTFAYRIGTPPAAPSGLTAAESTTAAGAANLRWTAAAGATGYNAYRNDIKVNASLLTGTSFTDTAAGLGDHSYVVRATEANGIESLDSNRVNMTIAAPDVPTGLRTTAGDARVTLNWTAVTGAADYRIYRDGAVVASRIAGTSYVNTGLTNGTLYEYSIASLDAGGNESPRTGIVQAVPAAAPAATAPGAPTIGAPTAGNASATVRWTAPTSTGGAAITGYTVRAYSGTTLVSTTAAGATATSVVVPSLTNGTSYTFDVAAINSAGTGTFSTRSTAVTPAAPAAGSRTVTVDATADTMVRQAAASTAGGALTSLTSDSEGTNGNLSTRETSYVRFAVPALNTGETVTAASLSLDVTNASTNGPAVWRTATTWTEGTMTWTTGQPARSGTAAVGNFGNLAVGRASTPVSGSMTGGSTVSFQLFAEASDGLDFSSRETTARPQLVLTVGSGGTTPPPADTTAPPAPSVNPATGTYASAQTLTATNTEAGVTHRYTVGTGTTVPADPTTASTALPAAGLPVNASFVVKVAAFDAAGNRSTVVTRTYTITTAGGGTRTVTVIASADATVRQSAPTTASGAATTLYSDGEATPGTASRDTSYLRFTVPALAAGESISAASLSLPVSNGTTDGPKVYRTNATWTEGTMTWNTGRPARSSTTAIGDFGAVGTGRVTTPVSGITASGPVSLELFADSTDGLNIASRETTTDPALVLTIRTP